MKVKDLIKQLSEMNPNAEVVHSQDSEGNGYIRNIDPYEAFMSSDELDSYGLYMNVSDEEDDTYDTPCVVFYP